jgi:hypothetical protein
MSEIDLTVKRNPILPRIESHGYPANLVTHCNATCRCWRLDGKKSRSTQTVGVPPNAGNLASTKGRLLI